MRKHATTLIAPLAALAVVGTVGAGAASATGDSHGDHGEYGGHQAAAVQVETSDEAEAALDEVGVTLGAVEPATAEESEDGTTEITFPTSAEQDFSSGEAAFDGGIAVTGASGETTWLEPAFDTSDWQVSFDVDGQRVDLLQVVPEDGSFATGGSESGHEADLALTAEGAEALNAVAGEGAFAEGDVFADAGAAEESGEVPDGDEPTEESEHGWDEPDHSSDHEWDEGDEGHDRGR